MPDVFKVAFWQDAWTLFESWTVRVALIFGMAFLFPGILYIVYDALLYVWRASFITTIPPPPETEPPPPPGTRRTYSGGTSSSSNSESDEG